MKWKSLLVAPDRQVAMRFSEALRRFSKGKAKIHYCEAIETGLCLASHYLPAVIFIDEAFGEAEIGRFIGEMRRENPYAVHIMMTEGEGAAALMRARQAGARDYMAKNRLDPAGFDRCIGALPHLEGRGRSALSLPVAALPLAHHP